MRNRFSAVFSLLLAATLVAGLASESHAQTGRPALAVMLQNDAGAPAAVVEQAKREATRLYSLVGIDLTWLDDVPSSGARFRVVSVTAWEPNDRKIATSVLGYTQA